MTGQVAQSLLVHFVGQVVGFRSIIPACNGGALTSKPPHTGVHTLRRAPAAALLPDHAAGTGIAPEIASGRGCAVVRFREVNIQPALCRGNGVAGAVGDDDLDLAAVSGIDDVIAPADAGIHRVRGVRRNPHCTAAADFDVVGMPFMHLRGRRVPKYVRTALGDGEHMDQCVS